MRSFAAVPSPPPGSLRSPTSPFQGEVKRCAWICLALLLTFALIGSLDAVLAQTTPFGGPRPPAPQGITGWILTQQALFYRALVQAVRAAGREGAALGLLTISFLYGVFHAAGPGHGKAVISSYLLADGSTFRRGLALTAAASLLQAVTAVAIVAVAAIALGATAHAMGQTVRVLEIGSYALIIAFGLFLTWQKGRALAAAWRERGHHHHGHAHDHGHAHREDGHSHGPEPAELKGKGWKRRGLAAVLGVGARPCSGAILVLVFALSQGIFWVGVLATFVMAVGTAITVAAIASLALLARGIARRFAARPGGTGMIAFHTLEVFGALLIVAFGALLATGMMASERLLPV
jgi:ABC-type nickel/cobalt efflux system permease component RcnA